jgi:hypothetical protein
MLGSSFPCRNRLIKRAGDDVQEASSPASVPESTTESSDNATVNAVKKPRRVFPYRYVKKSVPNKTAGITENNMNAKDMSRFKTRLDALKKYATAESAAKPDGMSRFRAKIDALKKYATAESATEPESQPKAEPAKPSTAATTEQKPGTATDTTAATTTATTTGSNPGSNTNTSGTSDILSQLAKYLPALLPSAATGLVGAAGSQMIPNAQRLGETAEQYRRRARRRMLLGAGAGMALGAPATYSAINRVRNPETTSTGVTK